MTHVQNPPLVIEPEQPALPFGHGWRTDFRRHTVPYHEFTLGHPQRDGIPPIDDPRFEPREQAGGWLAPQDPVAVVAYGDHIRAYPLAILMWHEIVNDTIAGLPLAVTFCPLCNIALAFERRLGERILSLGVSGLLRGSDLVMWDRETESLWQQATGEGLVGEGAGCRLRPLPTLLLAWSLAAERYPTVEVLSRQTGFQRAYGRNPYVAYDQSAAPMLLRSRPDPRLPALERVVGLRVGAEAVAYPFELLARRRVIDDVVGGTPLVVLYQPGMASPVDAPSIRQSHPAGMGTAWSRTCAGRVLSFAYHDGAIRDRETGSRWDVTGLALDGPLSGAQLEPIIHANHFWFAFAALLGPGVRVASG